MPKFQENSAKETHNVFAVEWQPSNTAETVTSYVAAHSMEDACRAISPSDADIISIKRIGSAQIVGEVMRVSGWRIYDKPNENIIR